MALARESVKLSRRVVLRGVSALGLSAAVSPVALGWLRQAEAQGPGNLGSLPPEEKVEATLKRLFGDRPIREIRQEAAAIKIDLPLIAENGAVVPITVAVESPMTPASHVRHIYVISDRNRRPMNAKFSLTPDAGAAWVGTNLRLGESTDVRVIADLSDGTLLLARRHVKVTIGGCGG